MLSLYVYFEKNGPFPASFTLFSSFQYTVDSKQMFNLYINFCRWLDSNHRPLVLEGTALPTEPQPLPLSLSVYLRSLWFQLTSYILSFHSTSPWLTTIILSHLAFPRWAYNLALSLIFLSSDNLSEFSPYPLVQLNKALFCLSLSPSTT